MALSQEQLDMIEMQNAVENVRHANQMAIVLANAKIESVRLAKETLIENARSKPVGDRDISAEDITNFANTLTTYVGS